MNTSNLTETRSEVSTKTLSNSTSPGPIMDIPSVQLNVYIVSLVVLSVCIITGNSLVIGAYRSNCRLQSGTFKFLVSLAVSDLLVGSIALPLWIYHCLSRWQVGIEGFYIIFVTLDVFSALASIYHLAVISVERYISIARPVAHRKLTRKFYNRSITSLWIIAATFALVYPFLVHFGSREAEKLYSLIVFIVGFVLPLTLISVMYGLIFRAVKILGVQHRERSSVRWLELHGKSKKKSNEGENRDSMALVRVEGENGILDEEKNTSSCQTRTDKSKRISVTTFPSAENGDPTEDNSAFQKKCHIAPRPGIAKTVETRTLMEHKNLSFNKERKTAITVGLITGIFFICWLPFFVVSVISFYCSYCLSLHINVAQLAMLVKWMHYGNSSVNPVVYSFRNPEIRKTFCKMMRFTFRRRKKPVSNHSLPYSRASFSQRSESR